MGDGGWGCGSTRPWFSPSTGKSIQKSRTEILAVNQLNGIISRPNGLSLETATETSTNLNN